MKRQMRYALIRLVPDPTRGEVINIGLMAGTEDREWFDLGFAQSFARVRAMSGAAAEGYAKALVRDFDASRRQVGRQVRMFQAAGVPVESILFEPRPSVPQGIVQVGEVHPALTDDPEGTFRRLFTQLVGGHGRGRRRPAVASESRDGMRRALRARLLDDWGLPQVNLLEGEVVGRVPHPVDFGLVNGQLRAVVHTVSFAAESHSAERQRAVLAETAWDLADTGARFTMLYAPARERDAEGLELQNSSVRFLEGFGITTVSVDDMDSIERVVAEVAARH